MVLWARYIDNVLLLWDGSEAELVCFKAFLNENDRGIKLSFETSEVEINFLDLKIKVQDSKLVTSTYFKATDKNSFIPLDSCHYEPWLRAVPLGQYTRLQHNCTEIETFDDQAAILTERSMEKGYDQDVLSRSLETVKGRDRSSLLGTSQRQAVNGNFNLPQHNHILYSASPD